MPGPALAAPRWAGRPRSPGCGFWWRSRRGIVQVPDFESPFWAGSTAMCPDRAAVDQLQQISIAAAVSKKSLEQNVPHARRTPAAELPPYRVPVAECRRQIAPGRSTPTDPEDAIQHAPMIAGPAAALHRNGDDDLLEDGPFIVRHQATNHGETSLRGSLRSIRLRVGGIPQIEVCPQSLILPDKAAFVARY